MNSFQNASLLIPKADPYNPYIMPTQPLSDPEITQVRNPWSHQGKSLSLPDAKAWKDLKKSSSLLLQLLAETRLTDGRWEGRDRKEHP